MSKTTKMTKKNTTLDFENNEDSSSDSDFVENDTIAKPTRKGLRPACDAKASPLERFRVYLNNDTFYDFGLKGGETYIDIRRAESGPQ